MVTRARRAAPASRRGAPARTPCGRRRAQPSSRAGSARSRRGSRPARLRPSARWVRWLAVGVSSPSRSSVVDRAPKADQRAVFLVVGQVVFDQPRRVAEEDRQHAGGERIERPAVTDSLDAGQAAHERHDVVRGGARLPWRRRGCRRGRARRWCRVSHRSASEHRRGLASTAGIACSIGRSNVAPAARACPPPPNAPVSTVASRPAVARADADLGPVAVLSEQDHERDLRPTG